MFNDKIIPDPSRIWNDDTKIAFYIGNFSVAWYGIFIFFGFCVAIFAAVIKAWKIYKVSTDVIYWYCIMLIPIGILGARFWSYCLGDSYDWSKFFNFKGGGLAIEGGVSFAVLLALWWFPFFSKNPKNHVRDEFGPRPAVRQVSMWVYADACIPAVFLGQIIGRWGNYFNQELYGPTVNAEWLQSALNHALPFMYIIKAGEWKQPLFLYEGFLNFVGWAIIYIGFEFVNRRKAGDMSLLYFVWYGIVRLALEPLRATDFTFQLSYVLSSIWVITGVILIILNHFVFFRLRKYHGFKLFSMSIVFLFQRFFKAIKTKKLIDNYKLEVEKLLRRDQEMLYYRGL